MKVKRPYQNIIIRILITLLAFYGMMRIMTLVEQRGRFKFDYINEALLSIYKITTPIIISGNTLKYSLFVSVFMFMAMEVFVSQNKKNMQENTYGSAEWGAVDSTKKLRDKEFINNMIFTQSDQISKNMHMTGLTRHILLVGPPGSGKSRFYFKPNVLSANGSIVLTDPKGELLRDCGYSLRKKGYTIKVLDLCNLNGNGYNCFRYIRKQPHVLKNKLGQEYQRYIDSDVLVLISSLIKNTKNDTYDSTTGDPFWEDGQTMFMQSLFFLILYEFPESKHNFDTFLDLIGMLKFDKETNSTIDFLFEKLNTKLGDSNIASRTWQQFKAFAKTEKTMATIVGMTVTRFSALNVEEVASIMREDEMELERLGAEGEAGKVAIFLVIDPLDSTFQFITGMFYTQLFRMLDQQAKLQPSGELATPVDIFMEEWAQLGEVPMFLEMLAYVRGLNVGITIGLQSLSQLKKRYPEDWETVFDCVAFFLFLGSQSKFTLEYVSDMLDKKTWYKKSTGRTRSMHGSNSVNLDVVGRELATKGELRKLKKAKCIFFIFGDYNPLYSNLYNLKKHPYYKDLYEPRQYKNLSMQLKRYVYEDYLSESQEERELQRKAKILGFEPCRIVSDKITTQKVSSLEESLLSEDTSLMAGTDFLKEYNRGQEPLSN